MGGPGYWREKRAGNGNSRVTFAEGAAGGLAVDLAEAWCRLPGVCGSIARMEFTIFENFGFTITRG